MSKVGVAVVGCGYWGQNLLRNFWESEQVRLVAACDLDGKALARVQRRYPTVDFVAEYSAILEDRRIDAVVLATPVSTHSSFARRALFAGKHVLVEKPLATSAAEALALLETADRFGKTLMVDHTFLYTAAVQRMRELIEAGELGELLYYDSVRINLGLVQNDTNVLWDLGPHDFSILDFLCEQEPRAVSAIGVRHMDCPRETMSYVTVRFDTDFIAHFHLNWLAPVKVRRTLVGGSKKMLVYDDLEATEKVKLYDRGIDTRGNGDQRTRLLTGYREGDIWAPHVATTEALRLMVRDFLGAVLEGRVPLANGLAGYRVVRLLEAAQRSMERGGREIELPDSLRARTLSDARAAVSGH